MRTTTRESTHRPSSVPHYDLFMSISRNRFIRLHAARTRQRRERENASSIVVQRRRRRHIIFIIRTRFYYKFNVCTSGGCRIVRVSGARVRTRNRCGVPRVGGRSARLSQWCPNFRRPRRRRLGISWPVEPRRGPYNIQMADGRDRLDGRHAIPPFVARVVFLLKRLPGAGQRPLQLLRSLRLRRT